MKSLPLLPEITPDALACRFHQLYEQLAPSFGYETREASAKPWAEVPEQNRQLMTAVSERILAELRAAPSAALPSVGLLILDLDGTVRECTVEGQPCPNRPGEQRLLPGAAEGIRAALESGCRVAFASNQGGVAAGFMTEEELGDTIVELLELLVDAGLSVAQVQSIDVNVAVAGGWSRKPSPGMLLAAMSNAEVGPGETLLVGDMASDEQAARAARCDFMWAPAWRAHFTDPSSR